MEVKKRSICSPYGGLAFVEEITDTELTYYTLQDSKRKKITWNDPESKNNPFYRIFG